MKKLKTELWKGRTIVLPDPFNETKFDDNGYALIDNDDITEEQCAILLSQVNGLEVININDDDKEKNKKIKELKNKNNDDKLIFNSKEEVQQYIVDNSETLSDEQLGKLNKQIEGFEKLNNEILNEKDILKQKLIDIKTVKELREFANDFPKEEWSHFQNKEDLRQYLISKI